MRICLRDCSRNSREDVGMLKQPDESVQEVWAVVLTPLPSVVPCVTSASNTSQRNSLNKRSFLFWQTVSLLKTKRVFVWFHNVFVNRMELKTQNDPSLLAEGAGSLKTLLYTLFVYFPPNVTLSHCAKVCLFLHFGKSDALRCNIRV